MLPGVELARRRRLHHRSSGNLHRSSDLTSSSLPQPVDQPAAAAARRRLEEKLRRPLPGSRSAIPSPSPFTRWMRTSAGSQENKGAKQVEDSSSSRGEKRGVAVGIARKPAMEICAVCLEGFRAKQQVIWLPCAHRYHSGCVLPWLEGHSHCPYCRTEVVHSLQLLSQNAPL